jgi:hypothetical protein
LRGAPPWRPLARAKAGLGALGDELALELGECGEDAEGQLALRGRGIDLDSLPHQHPQADVIDGEIVHGVDQVPKIPAEAVELPDHECIVFP